MKKLLIIAAGCAAFAGCVPGEATIKLSAEDVRRVLNGEVVEAHVQASAEMRVPFAEDIKNEVGKCPMCCRGDINPTNVVSNLDRMQRTAAAALTTLLADGSCVTGGVKVVGTNIVYWANVSTRLLFGTEAALIAASNKVENSNGYIVLGDNGTVILGEANSKIANTVRLDRIEGAFHTLEGACKLGVYMVAAAMGISQYDSVSFDIEGDGKNGFVIVTDKEHVASENIGEGASKTIVLRMEDKAVDSVRITPWP